MKASEPELVLASSSRYRAALLARLGLPFRQVAPATPETRQPGEAPAELVERLAREKAAAVAERLTSDALVIGSDQAAVLGDELLGKPGTAERAAAQLEAASGRPVAFLTGLALMDTRRGRLDSRVVPYRVHFRPFTRQTIRRYLAREHVLDCAGSFRAEGLGITLFRRMEGHDPSALIGLPLIALVDMLEAAGVELP